uniref:Uncharacterized protein n=1 Tax=Moniliophthora roreri TaxID=221103 RepID=A0A0W0G1B2_MONRR
MAEIISHITQAMTGIITVQMATTRLPPRKLAWSFPNTRNL